VKEVLLSYSAHSADDQNEMTQNKVNRLAQETSPYLQQHADNPVDWYPWGAEALQLARESGKPILLSVGYSACHWCHVMAHESFEDAATAELMNKLYVNVKVDREERPDLDKIYQTAHQLLTQRPGGWPLTMFIDPEDQRPFFGGTYFPNEARYGMPSFTDLITRVAGYFSDSRDEVKRQGQQLADIFARLEPKKAHGDVVLAGSPIDDARQQIEQNFDRDNGGTKGAPKFPHPTTLDRMLRHWRDTAHSAEPDIDALFQVSLTLTRMAEGGIYDHLGGGFCRYSVDAHWQIPHFEKMLYDNGPLLALYAQAWLVTGEDLFRRVAFETADWIRSDMQAADGGFYSSRDADSEGEEGIFYVWDPDDVREILAPDQYEHFAQRYGLNAAANFEGKWHLTVHESIKSISASAGNTEAEVSKLIDAARAMLLEKRAKRIAPGRDEKQLTSWNALAIRGLAIAGRALEQPDLVTSAQRATNFIRDNLFVEHRLRASFKDGEAKFSAYLDDHAFLLDALLEMLQAEWDTRNLEFAVDIADLLLEHFYDRQSGGFYFTADDHEQLMHRPKPLADEAMPSGNGVAVFALQRLGFMLGETRYLDAVEASLRNTWPAIAEYPHGHVSLITSLEEYLHHPETIIIRGDQEEVIRWRNSAAKLYAPRRMVFAIPRHINDLRGALADRKPLDGQTIAYRCVGSHCSLPIDSWEALATELSETNSADD
jgi:uncharacterized protein YyaL (SSP411 family)